MKKEIAALIVHVDYIIVTDDDHDEIARLKANLANQFEIKYLKNMRYFLGIKVARSQHGIHLSQQKYTQDLLQEVGLTGCRPIDTPINANHGLGELIEREEPMGRE